MLVLGPEMLTTLTFVTGPWSVPPDHWNKPLTKFSVTPGAATVPLARSTVPAPVPLIFPVHAGWLPPITSNVAPAATANVPLEVLPPSASVSVPVWTSTLPPGSLNTTETTESPVPPLFSNSPKLSNTVGEQQLDE